MINTPKNRKPLKDCNIVIASAQLIITGIGSIIKCILSIPVFLFIILKIASAPKGALEKED